MQAIHAPDMQTCPVAQAWPHAPQFAPSMFVLTHIPAQFVVVDGHDTPHAPMTHAWPIAQRVPHAPQLFGSERTSTHAPPHTIVPVGQPEQMPDAHTWPDAHA